MANTKKADVAENIDATADENTTSADLELLQAKHDALVEQVGELEKSLEECQSENEKLREYVTRLLEKYEQGSNSASIAPAAPKAPERPVVEIGGQAYRFKVGEVRLGRAVVSALDIAADEAQLQEVFGNYPGLFQKI